MNGQGAYSHIKPYESNCDATSAMNALRKAYEGSSMRNSRLREAYEKVSATTYEGNERSFPFSRFIEVLLTNYQIIEDYDKGMSDRHKITHMIKKINVKSTQVDMAIHNIQEQMDKDEDIRFDDAWPRIQTAITGSIDPKSKKSGIAIVETDGKKNGKRGKGKRVSFDNKRIENGIDYTDVNTQFTSEQWKSLSKKARMYITKGRKQDKSGRKQRKSDEKSKRSVAAMQELKQYFDQKLSNISIVSTESKTKSGSKRDQLDDEDSDGEVYYNEPQKRNKKKRS